MLRSIFTTAALLAAASAVAAEAASTPHIVGTPSAAFVKSANDGKRSYTMSAAARFDRTLPTQGIRVVIGPGLRKGQRVSRIFGGDQPHRIGKTSNHCYTIEVGRPAPVSTPKSGARWKLALLEQSGASDVGVVVDTAAVTLRRLPRDRAFGPAEAKRLGC